MNVFPVATNMEFNSKKIEIWDSVIVKKTGSGRRKSLSRRAYPDWEIQASFVGLTAEQRDSIAGFIAQHRGEHAEFLWLDPEEYQVTLGHIGVGDGLNTKFQLLRELDNRFIIPVTDYVSGTLEIWAGNVPVNVVSVTDGLATLESVPTSGAAVTATFQYYWRVAFDQGTFAWSNPFYDLYKFDTLKMVTV